MKSLLFIFLFIFSFHQLSAQTKQEEENTIVGFWFHCDGTVFSYLELSSDSLFHLLHQSNLGKSDSQGKYSLVGDALYLTVLKKTGNITNKYLYKDMQISVYPGATSPFRDFLPLVPTRRTYVEDAFKECNIRRMQEKKAKAKGGTYEYKMKD